MLLDEPTASLTSVEAERLLTILDDLRSTGVSLMYVSHRLDECRQIADRLVVLREGRVALNRQTQDTSANEVLQAMLGEAIREVAQAGTRERAVSAGPVRLALNRFNQDGAPGLRDVNLQVHSGEIVTVFGLVGSGVDTIASAVGGVPRAVKGEVTVDGTVHGVFKSPIASWHAGIAYVPAERKRDGLSLTQSVRANLMIRQPPSRFGVLNARAERRAADQLVKRWGIHYSHLDQPVGELSGGNQQKVLVASRVASNPRVLALYEPTRGVDIGARIDLHEHIRTAAHAGTAVLVVTSDVDEAVALSDRVIILRAGAIVAEFHAGQATTTDLIAAASGGTA